MESVIDSFATPANVHASIVHLAWLDLTKTKPPPK